MSSSSRSTLVSTSRSKLNSSRCRNAAPSRRESAFEVAIRAQERPPSHRTVTGELIKKLFSKRLPMMTYALFNGTEIDSLENNVSSAIYKEFHKEVFEFCIPDDEFGRYTFKIMLHNMRQFHRYFGFQYFLKFGDYNYCIVCRTRTRDSGPHSCKCPKYYHTLETLVEMLQINFSYSVTCSTMHFRDLEPIRNYHMISSAVKASNNTMYAYIYPHFVGVPNYDEALHKLLPVAETLVNNAFDCFLYYIFTLMNEKKEFKITLSFKQYELTINIDWTAGLSIWHFGNLPPPSNVSTPFDVLVE